VLSAIIGGVCFLVGLSVGFLAAGRRPRHAPESVEHPTHPEAPPSSAAAEAPREPPHDKARPKETPAKKTADEGGPDLEAECRRLTERVEELGTEIRRYRRWATERLQSAADALEALWKRQKLPRLVHELGGLEIPPETRAEIHAGAEPMSQWISEFAIGTAQMHYLLGLCAVLDGAHDRAARAFQQAAFDGFVPDSWLALGDSQWRLDRRKKAAKTYARCLDHKRMPNHIYERVAMVAIDDRQYEQALSTIQRILVRKTAGVDAFILASQACGKLGDHQRAIEICQEGLQQHPDSAQLLASMIIPLSHIGDLARAEECAARARELVPEIAGVPFGLGVARMNAGDHSKAIRHFEEALKLQPDHHEALFCLGVIANSQGKFKKALDYFQKTVKLKPDYAEAYFNMKESYEGLRDFDNAIAVLNKAVQLNPDYS
jgi:tetratricopeptide (TPR) repeat protein